MKKLVSQRVITVACDDPDPDLGIEFAAMYGKRPLGQAETIDLGARFQKATSVRNFLHSDEVQRGELNKEFDATKSTADLKKLPGMVLRSVSNKRLWDLPFNVVQQAMLSKERPLFLKFVGHGGLPPESLIPVVDLMELGVYIYLYQDKVYVGLPPGHDPYSRYNTGLPSGKAGAIQILHQTARRGNISSMRSLLANQAYTRDVLDGPDPEGCAPLHTAVRVPYINPATGDVDIVKELLWARSSVNHQDPQGLTPLHYAIWTPHPEQDRVVKVLLDSHADPHKLDSFGKVPIDYAEFEHDPVNYETLDLSVQAAKKRSVFLVEQMQRGKIPESAHAANGAWTDWLFCGCGHMRPKKKSGNVILTPKAQEFLNKLCQKSCNLKAQS